MKNKITKYSSLFLLIVMILSTCLIFADRKSGMFIDEIYTYGLSNNHEGAYLNSISGGSLEDKVFSRQDFFDYVVVNEDEDFDFKAVYYNQAEDVHPPLYYWLFNIASSLTPGVFSKWTGIVLDLIIYTAALVLLYALLNELFKSQLVSLAGVAMYGFSLLGFSTALMIRMYVLVTMLTVLLAYLVARLMREKKTSLYVLTGLTIFAGVMTQYYFVFYAFFLCAAFVLYSLYKKDFKGILVFAASAFAGIALMLICFPHCLDQLFADKLVSGGNALENLGNTSQYAERLIYFYSEVRHGLKATIIICLAVFAALLVFCKKAWHSLKNGEIELKSLLFIVPAFVTLVLVALISPVMDQRYVYNIVPIFVVAACLLIHILEKCTSDIKTFAMLKWCALVLLVLFTMFFARRSEPLYQYPEHADYNAQLSAYSDAPCVFLTDEHFEGPTESLIQLLTFDSVFMSSDPNSSELDKYLDTFNCNECVVFIDVNEFWSSGFDPDIMLPQLIDSTEFSTYEKLYSYNLSEIYLLRK